jgi:hypothetical protein
MKHPCRINMDYHKRDRRDRHLGIAAEGAFAGYALPAQAGIDRMPRSCGCADHRLRWGSLYEGRAVRVVTCIPCKPCDLLARAAYCALVARSLSCTVVLCWTWENQCGGKLLLPALPFCADVLATPWPCCLPASLTTALGWVSCHGRRLLPDSNTAASNPNSR